MAERPNFQPRREFINNIDELTIEVHIYRYEQDRYLGSYVISSTAVTPALKELSNAVDSVVNWFSLGVKLELERHMLIQIEKDHRGDNERCKYEMLDRWLRNAKQPTWKAMADALCLIGEHQAALNIRTKYCSSGSSTANGMSVYSCIVSATRQG